MKKQFIRDFGVSKKNIFLLLAAPDEYYETDHDAHHFFRVTVTIASTTFDAHVMVSHDGMFRVMDRNTCQVSNIFLLLDIDHSNKLSMLYIAI